MIIAAVLFKVYFYHDPKSKGNSFRGGRGHGRGHAHVRGPRGRSSYNHGPIHYPGGITYDYDDYIEDRPVIIVSPNLNRI